MALRASMGMRMRMINIPTGLFYADEGGSFMLMKGSYGSVPWLSDEGLFVGSFLVWLSDEGLFVGSVVARVRGQEPRRGGGCSLL